MIKKVTFFFILFLQVSVFQIRAQVGTEFWFAAPDVTNAHTDRPIYLRITSASKAALVTISLPANASFTALTYSFAANQTQTIDLTPFISSIETSAPDSINDTGILIQASNPISVYYEVRSSGNNTDIFALKGSNAAGVEFYVPAQSFWDNASSYSQAFSMFLVTATEDGTIVTINPTNNLVGRTAGVAFTINLNRGETYYARASSRSASGHVGGTSVSSNKPIVITIADDSAQNSTYGSCRDLAGDQLIPISKIGKEYIIIKGFLKKSGNSLDDKVYVVATENNTQLYLDGNATPTYTLSKGQQQELSLSNASLYLESSEDIYVLHITGFNCEIGAAVLPSLYCTGSDTVVITRSTSEDFYLLLLVPTGSEDDFTTDGDNSIIKKNDFVVVPGTNGAWMMNRLQVGTNKIGVGTVTSVENATSLFHLGVINGGASTGAMYGYFSDFASITTGAIFHF